MDMSQGALHALQIICEAACGELTLSTIPSRYEDELVDLELIVRFRDRYGTSLIMPTVEGLILQGEMDAMNEPMAPEQEASAG